MVSGAKTDLDDFGKSGAAGKAAPRASGSLALQPWGFGLKTVAATLGGSILTLCVAVAQIWYAERLETIDRQGREGLEFQTRLLALTGAVDNALMRTAAVVKNEAAPASQLAAPALRAGLEQIYGRWRSERLLLRNQAAQIYGRRVGSLVYDVSEQAFDVDRCNVVVRLGQPAEAGDCAERLHREAEAAERFVRRIRQSRGLEAFDRAEDSPRSFDANLQLTRKLLSRYARCVGESGRLYREACADLRRLVVMRAELVGIARENFAQAIMESSTLRD